MAPESTRVISPGGECFGASRDFRLYWLLCVVDTIQGDLGFSDLSEFYRDSPPYQFLLRPLAL